MLILYKSLPVNRKPNGFQFKKGVWHKIDGDIEICKKGFHASENIIDAMGYVICGWIARVEVRGKSIIQEDKQCWSEMKILEWHKWTKKDSVSLAIYTAELVLDNYEKQYPGDKRPREAIEAAKNVLKNDTEKNRSAAWSAASAAESAARSSAESAARSAAWSAESAAWSAAESAASVAESAARSSAESAESAAWSAAKQHILDKCHDFVINRKFKT